MALIQSGNYTGQATKSLYLTPDRLAKEALFRLKHFLVFPRMAMNQYMGYMGRHAGNSINIKLPFLTTISEGVTMSKKDIVDRFVTIKVDKRYHFALGHSDTERTFDINDFSNRYLKPGLEELAYRYDIDGAEELTFGAGYVHGKAGTAMKSETCSLIRAFASEMAIPQNESNFAVMHPLQASRLDYDMLSEQKVNHPGLISQAVRSRFRGLASYWNVVDSVHIPHMDCASPSGSSTPLTNGATQDGSSIVTDGWAASEQKVLNKGQVITFAGVYDVIPRGNRKSTGRLKRFTVTEDVSTNSSGAATIKVTPEIIASDSTITAPNAGGSSSMAGYQNVSNKVADNSAITVLGTAGKTYRQSLFFERNALQYVNVTLEIPDAAKERGMAVDPETGLSITMVGDFTLSNLTSDIRADVIYGVKTTYPEIAIRVLGDEVDQDYL